MSTPRVASFVPAATEWMLALGLGGRLVGVTDACRAPEAVPRLVKTTDLGAVGADAIDAAVRKAGAEARALHALDADALRAARPDVILAQGLCNVCGPGSSHVEEAVAILGYRPEVVELSPASFEEAMADGERIAAAAGVPGKGGALLAAMQLRLARVSEALDAKEAHVVPPQDPPRVAVLEWTAPPFRSGHWFPDVVEMAGGDEVLGRPGEKSVACTWADVEAARPEVLVVAPCGLTLAQAAAEAERVASRFPGVRVVAVDASRYLSSSGPSLAIAVELFAHLLHPDAWERDPDASAWREVQSAGS